MKSFVLFVVFAVVGTAAVVAQAQSPKIKSEPEVGGVTLGMSEADARARLEKIAAEKGGRVVELRKRLPSDSGFRKFEHLSELKLSTDPKKAPKETWSIRLNPIDQTVLCTLRTVEVVEGQEAPDHFASLDAYRAEMFRRFGTPSLESVFKGGRCEKQHCPTMGWVVGKGDALFRAEDWTTVSSEGRSSKLKVGETFFRRVPKHCSVIISRIWIPKQLGHRAELGHFLGLEPGHGEVGAVVRVIQTITSEKLRNESRVQMSQRLRQK